jgi:hypothetical protein
MLAGVSGGVLLLSLFLPWYRFRSGTFGVDYTGWESFSALDILLAVVAAMAIAVALMTAVHPTAAVPIALASLLALVGLVALVLTAVRVFSPPYLHPSVIPANLLPRPTRNFAHTSREYGAWLGFAGCIGATVAALISMRDESYPRAVRDDSHVEVDTLPAPPPEGAAEGQA